jgi:hypothetical protein
LKLDQENPMKRALALIAIPATLVAQDTPPAPKQATKVDLMVHLEGKEPITLPAKRPEMAARANMWTQEKFWRLLFPMNQPEVPGGAFTFSAAVDPNDLPGGGFYLCSMKKDDDKVYFNISSDAAGSPKGDFVVLKPTDLPGTKNPNGSYTFKASKPLKPGPYAIYSADNQYAWPFLVK